MGTVSSFMFIYIVEKMISEMKESFDQATIAPNLLPRMLASLNNATMLNLITIILSWFWLNLQSFLAIQSIMVVVGVEIQC